MTFKSLAAVLMLAFGFQLLTLRFSGMKPFLTKQPLLTIRENGGTNSRRQSIGLRNGPTTWMRASILALPPASQLETLAIFGLIDGNGLGAHDVRLTGTGNPANATGKLNVHLDVHFFRTISGADVARIGVSTNGTTFTYHNVPEFHNLVAEVGTNFQFYEGPIEVAIPEADGQSQVWIQFRWEGNFEYYWKVDDLELYEPVAAISDVTFQVNTTLISVNPAGMFIAGTFTGLTPVAMTHQGGGIWSILLPWRKEITNIALSTAQLVSKTACRLRLAAWPTLPWVALIVSLP